MSRKINMYYITIISIAALDHETATKLRFAVNRIYVTPRLHLGREKAPAEAAEHSLMNAPIEN